MGIFHRMEQAMVVHNLAPSTRTAYLYWMRRFVAHFRRARRRVEPVARRHAGHRLFGRAASA